MNSEAVFSTVKLRCHQPYLFLLVVMRIKSEDAGQSFVQHKAKHKCQLFYHDIVQTQTAGKYLKHSIQRLTQTFFIHYVSFLKFMFKQAIQEFILVLKKKMCTSKSQFLWIPIQFHPEGATLVNLISICPDFGGGGGEIQIGSYCIVLCSITCFHLIINPGASFHINT